MAPTQPGALAAAVALDAIRPRSGCPAARAGPLTARAAAVRTRRHRHHLPGWKTPAHHQPSALSTVQAPSGAWPSRRIKSARGSPRRASSASTSASRWRGSASVWPQGHWPRSTTCRRGAGGQSGPQEAGQEVEGEVPDPAQRPSTTSGASRATTGRSATPSATGTRRTAATPSPSSRAAPAAPRRGPDLARVSCWLCQSRYD
jgi:hypothetical protein